MLNGKIAAHGGFVGGIDAILEEIVLQARGLLREDRA